MDWEEMMVEREGGREGGRERESERENKRERETERERERERERKRDVCRLHARTQPATLELHPTVNPYPGSWH